MIKIVFISSIIFCLGRILETKICNKYEDLRIKLFPTPVFRYYMYGLRRIVFYKIAPVFGLRYDWFHNKWKFKTH